MNDVRALLLTDVVGSTQMSERLGDAAMAVVWTEHDRAARRLLPEFGGREIDKTDGMLLLFDRAADAVDYALAYHRALASLPTPLLARAGLHVGPVILRENPPDDVARGAKPLEVDGMAKPTAARVMSLAAGGQTLLTPDALQALGETRLHHQSHGFWVMKGVSEPVELFEVGEDPSRFVAPPDSDKVYRVLRVGERWLPVREIPNNLPQQNTSFVGREKELDDIKARLGTARLITLLGMGGLGKTRLSLQVAAESMPSFPDGAWFIDLSPIRDPSLVVAEAARVLDVSEEPGRPLLETLCAYLKPRRSLLVIDNCEHLIDPAGDMVDALLRAVPEIRIIASSREALDVPGEQSYPIHPLPLPGRGDGVAALSRSTAVRLFVERVQQHRPDFLLEERDAPDVADLVARLEGIPLAIELAAARMRTLEVADINIGLEKRYQLLTGGSRRLQARQQTLRALVDWSYDMLKDEEQRVLERLGVFVGGFDTPGAEAVCGVEPVAAGRVATVLQSLAEKSLLMRDETAGFPRFRMLETIRDYACDKLAARDETASAAERHCMHYFGFAKDGNRGLQGADQARWAQRFESELDNLRSATALALSGGVDPVISIKLSVAMLGFWMLRGYATEGRGVVRAALALPAVQQTDVAHAWGLYVGAALAGSQGEHQEARQMLETCLAIRRGLDNPVEIAATLSTLSLTRLQGGDAAGAAEVEREALELFRGLQDRIGEAIGLSHLALAALHVGDHATARVELEQALALAREVHHRELEAETLLLLGQAAQGGGHPDIAAERFEASLAVCREAADRQGEANALRWLGKSALGRGEHEQAARLLADALRAFQAYEMRDRMVEGLEDHAALLRARGRVEPAVAIAAAAAQARSRLALVRPAFAEGEWAALLDTLRAQAGAGRFEAAWARGRRFELEEAVREALAGSALELTPA